MNPQATVADAWPGWDDPSKSKREAEAMIAQGVDVIMQNVDSASRGVFEAVAENNSQPKTRIRSIVYTLGRTRIRTAMRCAGITCWHRR